MNCRAEVDFACAQGASEAAERAQAAVREGEEAVARVQEQYEAALAEVDKLVKERQRWQEAWDEERQSMKADKAALAASMEVSCHSHPCRSHSAMTSLRRRIDPSC
jgi:chromosome segregation ATPase